VSRGLGGHALDPERASELVQATADIALILDGNGIVLEVIVEDDLILNPMAEQLTAEWTGKPWADLVTVESRDKIRALLDSAANDEAPSWRQVNHPKPDRLNDWPVRYCAMRLAETDRFIAVGRDLNAIAELQQRLVAAQESAEQDYWRLRQAESRFRLLFQLSSDPVLVVDGSSQRVTEANPAASRLLGDSEADLVNQKFAGLFDDDSGAELRALLSRAESIGNAEIEGIRTRAGAAPAPAELSVQASLLRHGNSSVYIVRLSSAGAERAPLEDATHRLLLNVIAQAPDAVVVTNDTGAILSANRAFADLAQLASEEQARGRSLSEWLGRSSVDTNVLVANLRQHGAVRLFGTSVRGAHGVLADVEVSAIAVPAADTLNFGFIIRTVGSRLQEAGGVTGGGRQSVEQLTELVGRVPLKELVRESADLIERLSIEAALKLTHDNRAAAAEMLGLSRQSLYVKLRRYGIGESGKD